MSVRAKLLIALCLLGGAAARAPAECMLCPPDAPAGSDVRPPAPLYIDIDSALDFDRIAVSAPAGGSVTLDAQGGARRISGALVDLGGLAMRGAAVVRGEPGRAVRIELPAEVVLRTGEGATARLSALATDLPPFPRLGPDGRLRFAFGGRLDVSGDADGDYRGRIGITVAYQ